MLETIEATRNAKAIPAAPGVAACLVRPWDLCLWNWLQLKNFARSQQQRDHWLV